MKSWVQGGNMTHYGFWKVKGNWKTLERLGVGQHVQLELPCTGVDEVLKGRVKEKVSIIEILLSNATSVVSVCFPSMQLFSILPGKLAPSSLTHGHTCMWFLFNVLTLELICPRSECIHVQLGKIEICLKDSFCFSPLTPISDVSIDLALLC